MISPDTNPFWRVPALEPHEKELLGAVLDAHYKSAFRENLSSTAVKLAAAGSGDYTKAIAAALSTLGGVHAPLVQTYQFLADDDLGYSVNAALEQGLKVPGWGNSFHKGEPDPLWQDVDRLLRTHWPSLAARMDHVTGTLLAAGKNLQPNPSAYTALSAAALGMSAHVAPYLFVMGRLQGWSELFAFPS